MKTVGMTGKHHTEETKQKLREARAKQIFTPEVIAKRIQSLRGKVRSSEQRARYSAARLRDGRGRPSRLGKKHTSASLEKMRIAQQGRITSVETRRKQSEALKGSKSYLWRGGLTQKNLLIRHSFEYRLWREAVFKRDNYTCVWCGATKVAIHPDHIKPFALFPELRLAIDNGRTLCVPCHKTTDTYGHKTRWHYKRSVLGEQLSTEQNFDPHAPLG